jgi:hypothetical protein
MRRPWRLRELEPVYRSRGEAQLGRFLRRYNIPFLYEPPVSVYHAGRERVWHPDFVLPTYGDLIVEYAGMPDRPEYMRQAMGKQQIYRQNGRESLFVYPRGPPRPTMATHIGCVR